MSKKIDRSKVKYIYNLHWANYLVLNGGVVTGVGINKKTGSPFVAFDYESVQSAYEKLVEKDLVD